MAVKTALSHFIQRLAVGGGFKLCRSQTCFAFYINGPDYG